MPEEQELRQQMVALGRRAYERGYIVAGEGNFSARIGTDTLLVTPAGRNKGDLQTEELIRVDLSGNPLPGEGRPSSEIRMHTAVYAARPDVGAVIHSHAPMSTAFAVAGIPLDRPLLAESIVILGSVPIAPYATPSTSQVADAVRPLMAKHNALLLANHGTLTVGATLPEAYNLLETLEHVARISLLVHLLGRQQPIPAHKVEELLHLQQPFRPQP